MKKNRTTQESINRAQRNIGKLLLAAQSCVKCGYGFAGKKPNPMGKEYGTVPLSESDPKYSEAEPCPSCGFEAKSSAGEEGKEPIGFGKKYFVLDEGIYAPDEALVGPFFDKETAEDFKKELEEEKGKVWRGTYVPKVPEGMDPDSLEYIEYAMRDPNFEGIVSKENQEKVIWKSIHVIEEDDRDSHEQGLSPISPRKHIQEVTEVIEKRIEDYFSNRNPTKPNVAKLHKSIHRASYFIQKALIKLAEPPKSDWELESEYGKDWSEFIRNKEQHSGDAPIPFKFVNLHILGEDGESELVVEQYTSLKDFIKRFEYSAPFAYEGQFVPKAVGLKNIRDYVNDPSFGVNDMTKYLQEEKQFDAQVPLDAIVGWSIEVDFAIAGFVADDPPKQKELDLQLQDLFGNPGKWIDG